MNREEQTSRRKFKETYGCKYCYYYQTSKCAADQVCMIEEEERTRNAKKTLKVVCPKDQEGGCPYGNDVGTCFGFCWKDILQEFYENKRNKHKQEERKDELSKN